MSVGLLALLLTLEVDLVYLHLHLQSRCLKHKEAMHVLGASDVMQIFHACA